MRRVTQMVGRIIALCLAFVLGFFSAFGAIAGGIYLAYSEVSVDKINEWSEKLGLEFRIPTEQLVNPDAEKPITTLTIQDLLAEVSYYTEYADKLTLALMVERYGLVLTPETIEKIPEIIYNEIPIGLLFSNEGMQELMTKITVDDIFGMIPGDIAGNLLTDPVRYELGDHTLADIVEMDLGYIFSGVQLGFLIASVTYDYTEITDEEGNVIGREYVVVKSENPTIMELVAPLDLGNVISSLTTSGGNIMGEIKRALEGVAAEELLATFMDTDIQMLSALLKDMMISDLIVEKDGVYVLDFEVAMAGKCLGEMLGATRNENGEWVTPDGKIAPKLNNAIYSVALLDLLDSGDAAGVVLSTLGGLRVGDIVSFNYDEVEKKWYKGDEERTYATAMENMIYSAELSSLIGENSDPVNAILGDAYIGDMLGYERTEENIEAETVITWVDADGNPVKGLYERLSDYKVTELMSGSGLSMTELLDGLTIGELLEYTCRNDLPVYLDGNLVDVEINVWYQNNGNLVDKLMGALANMDFDQVSTSISDLKIKDIMGYCEYNDSWYTWNVVGTGDNQHIELTPDDGIMTEVADISIKNMSDSEDGIEATLKGLKIGELMGHTMAEDGTWYEDKEMTKEVSGVMSAFVDLTINEMASGNTVQGKIDAIQISDVLGYEYSDGAWRKDGKKVTGVMGAIAGIAVGELDTEVEKIAIGELLGYTREYKKDSNGQYILDSNNNKIFDCWLDSNKKPVEGVMSAFVDLSLKDMSNSSTVQGKIDSITISEVMGYEERADGWYKEGVKVTGVMGAIAGIAVGDLGEKVDQIAIGELLGYTREYKKDGDGQYILDSNNNKIFDCWIYSNKKPVEGVMSAFVDLSLKDMGDNDTVQSKIDGITIADVLGYEERADGWYKNGEPVTGIMGSIAGSTVGSLNDDIQNVTIGEMLNYTPVYEKNANGELVLDQDGNKVIEYWLTPVDEDGNQTRATGVIAALADASVANLNSKLDQITVGEVLGFVYDKDTDTWYDGNKPATGVTGALAGTELDQLNGALNTLKIGEIAGYTKFEVDDEEYWCDCSKHAVNEDHVKATGILGALANMTVDGLTHEENLSDAINGITLADAMGYSNKNGKWFKDNDDDGELDPGEEVTGVLAVLAGSRLNNLDTAINDARLGEILGYTPMNEDEDGNAEYWITGEIDSEGNPVRVSGFMMLLADSKISSIGEDMDAKLRGTSMQFFINEGLISFDDGTDRILDTLSMNDLVAKPNDGVVYPSNVLWGDKVPAWRTKPLAASFSYIVNLLYSSSIDVGNSN